jgi:hypothetical protein
MPRGPVPPPAAEGADAAAPAVRAQLLTTEHWSLLATRSMTQNEILNRITMFLMLVSASIVSLALIAQATHFSGRFITFALVLVGMVVMIGTLTQLRVGNYAIEDLGHVIGMNRLRAAYLELDPTIGRYLVTSPHDDDQGVSQTYNPLLGRTRVMTPLASSGAFIALLNAALTGVFAALVAVALHAPRVVVGVAAAAGVLSFLGVTLTRGPLGYQRLAAAHVPLFPASGSGAAGVD